MKYAIKNRKNVYIRLNENGKAVTCCESEKGLFEYSKAKNILNSLSKNLKKLKFDVEAVPDIKLKSNSDTEKSIKNEEYMLSENITRWIEKFGTCADIFNEAKKREKELTINLHKSDNELIDILHIIEIEKPKDLYGGWLIYKRIRNNRKKRRELKDEILIVKNVIEEINPSCFNRERIQKSIDGLFTRKYSFRIIEEDQKSFK